MEIKTLRERDGHFFMVMASGDEVEVPEGVYKAVQASMKDE